MQQLYDVHQQCKEYLHQIKINLKFRERHQLELFKVLFKLKNKYFKEKKTFNYIFFHLNIINKWFDFLNYFF